MTVVSVCGDKGRKRVAGAVLATALLCTGAVACQGSDGGKKTKGAGSGETQSRSQVTEVITAAYKKTSAAKSAKVEMTMSMPSKMDGGGTMKMSGVMGWDPTVMDMTMTGSALTAGDPDAPEKVRMLWRDNVMYMDMGEAAAKGMGMGMDGKRWMKMDLNAIAEQAGDPKLAKQMTGGLDSMNQDPAQQLALLLDSPNLKHVGSAKVDGVQTQRYKGRLTVKEMMESNEGLDDVLSKSERDELFKGIEKSGIKGYDTEVWVNEDDYPVRMDIDVKSPEGTMKTSQKFSDYGAAAKVTAPPAKETFDLMEMFKELGELGKDGAGSGADSGF
ncbi:hypothetical protein OG453_00075 [Streptomyces sp. NBC_01381]|uniref:hypothetical protein n=1 Tax=Streptomyces sp. NBC_01381 TaxID=2903845 RepID=UPI00224FFF00|nr:hypothetical protein [Streptomyces sp. NBC_01381]MCX4665084.1 hypothetical protein [Streptomyces sp. NBC_01381]